MATLKTIAVVLLAFFGLMATMLHSSSKPPTTTTNATELSQQSLQQPTTGIAVDTNSGQELAPEQNPPWLTPIAFPDHLPGERPETSLVVIHHSATETGNAQAFRRYHVDHNKWADIGYHGVITTDGTWEPGRHKDSIGAHAGKGDPRNRTSISVCLVGTDTFTEQQIETLITVVADYCRTYEIIPSISTIIPHHEECPGHGLDFEHIVSQVSARLSDV